MTDDDLLKAGSNEIELVDFRILKKTKDGVYEGIYGVNVSKVKGNLNFFLILWIGSAKKR